MKQRVIIAYDGSPDGKQALTLGNLLCRTFDAKPVIAYRGGEKVSEMDRGYFQNTADKSPARGLKMLTQQVKPMAIVVGSPTGGHGERGTSTSDNKRILASTNCPIAVAPPASQALRGFSRICVGVNGHDSSYGALDQAAAMARLLGVSLRIVSVVGSGQTSGRKSRSGLSEARVRRATKVLEDAARRVPADVTVELDGLVGDPAETLGEYSHDFDLMVVGAKSHGRFSRNLRRGISTYLMEHARCPMLITPDGPMKGKALALG